MSNLLSLFVVSAFVFVGGLYATVLAIVYDMCPLPHCIGADNNAWMLGVCLMPLGMAPLIAAFFLLIRF